MLQEIIEPMRELNYSSNSMTDIMQEIQMCVRLIIEVSIYRRYFHRYPQFG